MNADFFRACERLLSATANGVYQGVLVALLAGLALRLFARTNAATRYAVWFGVLLFVAALIPAHLLLSFQPQHENPAAASSPSGMTLVALLPPNSEKAAAADFASAQTDESETANIEGAPYLLPADRPLDESAGAETGSQVLPNTVAMEQGGSISKRTPLNALIGNAATVIRLPHSVCVGLVAAWLVLASVRVGLIAGRIKEARRIKRTSAAPSQELQTLFERLRGSLATKRNVQLRVSNAHRTAVLLGFVHPVVLLPTEMEKDADGRDVEHVLRHELAHVVRWDDWGNLAQQLIQAAVFFHPAIWWICAKLSLEREIACDDRVLEASGRPRAYALTLANVASRMNRCRHLLAPGVLNNHSQLQQRITMILNTQRNRSPRLAGGWLGIFATATAMLAFLAIAAGPRLVLAQSPAAEPVAVEAAIPVPRAVVARGVGVAPVAGLLPEAQPGAITVAGVSPAPGSADWSGAESGPRPKPGVIEYDAAPSIAPVPRTAAALPEPPELASAPEAPMMPVPALAPDAPTPPAPGMVRAGKRHQSVEERLDRIERILEDLEARRDGKGYYRGDSVSGSLNKNSTRPDVGYGMSAGGASAEFETKRAAEQARMAADQVRRAVEAGQRAADMAMRDVARLKTRDFARLQEDMRAAESENSEKALEALREARGTLQAQMKTLEKQIKRLEEERSGLKRPGGSSGSSAGESQKP